MTPYVGEIRLFAGNFAPLDWAFCDGSLVSVVDYETLFSLIGTTYGGNGQDTFALPDLRGRVPIHMGTGSGLTPRPIGETGGVEAVTLTTQQLPPHSHAMAVTSSGATSTSPVGGIPAATGSDANWAPGPATVARGTTTPTGGSQPHDNLQPFGCINYIISLYGIYPSQA